MRDAGNQPHRRARHPAGGARTLIGGPPRERRRDPAAVARLPAFVIDDAEPALVVAARADEEFRTGREPVDLRGLVERRGAHRDRAGIAAVADGAAAVAGGEARPLLADPHRLHQVGEQRRIRFGADIRRRRRAFAGLVDASPARRSRQAAGQGESSRVERSCAMIYRGARTKAMSARTDCGNDPIPCSEPPDVTARVTRSAHGLLADEIGAGHATAGTTSSATAAPNGTASATMPRGCTCGR